MSVSHSPNITTTTTTKSNSLIISKFFQSILKLLFKLILNLILYSILLIKQIKIFIYEFYYIIITKIKLINWKNYLYYLNIKLNNQDKNIIDHNNNINNSNNIEINNGLLATTSSSVDIPSNICIIINECLNNEQLKNLCLCIIDTLSSIGVHKFLFYTFKGKYI